MHKLFTYLCSALLLVTATSCERKTEKLLLGGFQGWNKIVIIDKNTKQVEWEHPLEKGWGVQLGCSHSRREYPLCLC